MSIHRELTDQILNLLKFDELNNDSLSPEDKAKLLAGRNKLFTGLRLIAEVDSINAKMSLNTMQNLTSPEELEETYDSMKEQILRDENQTPDKKFVRPKRTAEVDSATIAFQTFKIEFRRAKETPSTE